MRYHVRALSAGQLISLQLDAQHEEDAFRQVLSQGYEAVSVEALSGKLKSGKLKLGSNKRFPILLFSQELLALINAGLGLVEALEGITEKEQRPEVQAILQSLLDALYQGQTFSAAVAAQAQTFPALYAAMIRASEKTGDLPEALMRYIAYEQQVELLKKKLITSSIYPLLLLVVGTLVILFLLGYVVPRFSQIYADNGSSQPWMLKLVLGWSNLIEQHGQVLLAGGVAVISLLVYALSIESVRGRLMSLLWKAR